MPLFRGTRLPLILSGRRYIDKVLSHGPIAYWPMNEGSGSVAYCQVDPAQNGAYTGVTLGEAGIGDRETCPFFDGTTDYNNIYSAALNAAFDGQAGTVVVWGKVNAAAVWEDEANRRIVSIHVDGANNLHIRRSATDNQLLWYYEGGDSGKIVTLDSLSATGWMCLGMTWDLSAGEDGEARAFYNGLQTGATQTGLEEWDGSFNATHICIGAYNTTPQFIWHGWAAHGMLFDTAKTPAAMLDLATL